MSDELIQHPGTPARPMPTVRKPARAGVVAFRAAFAFNGVEPNLEEHYDMAAGEDRWEFNAVYRDGDGEELARCGCVVQGEGVRWHARFWVQEKWQRQGFYKHIVRDLREPLLEMGVKWWVIDDTNGVNTEDGRATFVKSGFEEVDGWLVSDRSDPDAKLNRWAER